MRHEVRPHQAEEAALVASLVGTGRLLAPDVAMKIWTFQEGDIRAEHVVTDLRDQGIDAELVPPDWGRRRNGVRVWLSDEVAEALGIKKPPGGALGAEPCMADG